MSAEDAIRKRLAQEQAAQQNHSDELRKQIFAGWAVLEREAHAALARLEAKGYPDGHLTTVWETTTEKSKTWWGKVTVSTKSEQKEVAAWTIVNYFGGCDREMDPFTRSMLLLSDGRIRAAHGFTCEAFLGDIRAGRDLNVLSRNCGAFSHEAHCQAPSYHYALHVIDEAIDALERLGE